MEKPNAQKGLKLSTVRQFTDRHEAWSPSGMRDLIFKAEDRVNSRNEVIPGNGLAPAIIRIGRKVLIDDDKFFEWVEQHRCTNSASSDEHRSAA